MDTVLLIALGLGLSAACGFRVFVPLLVMGVAARTGYLTLASRFEWLGSDPAIAALAIATLIEVLAYSIPWLDNLLDTVAAPAAVVAGIVATASITSDMDPLLGWSLAAIAGGGAAAAVQAGSTVTRAASTVGTGGLANPLLAATELGGSLGLSVLAIAVPVVALLVVVVLSTWVLARVIRRSRRSGGLRSEI